MQVTLCGPSLIIITSVSLVSGNAMSHGQVITHDSRPISPKNLRSSLLASTSYITFSQYTSSSKSAFLYNQFQDKQLIRYNLQGKPRKCSLESVN
ncbi:hypothetical protein E2C01_060260 [Portunus trituberculatus]|uniref:Uncharacterized protein n=1 Tax=Portunus trituberculatus TaxID=210409 RepID=A0A5B7H888_PORTR|nr:hypothetical protein [Portunus trituberculatus]